MRSINHRRPGRSGFERENRKSADDQVPVSGIRTTGGQHLPNVEGQDLGHAFAATWLSLLHIQALREAYEQQPPGGPDLATWEASAIAPSPNSGYICRRHRNTIAEALRGRETVCRNVSQAYNSRWEIVTSSEALESGYRHCWPLLDCWHDR